ncbi:MAG: gamma carbonic anhydrase family protein [Flavobacteriaceae bacterium]|nr:gamma carbonic anhydrase family protein [Flavobacteriaceae bacterium]
MEELTNNNPSTSLRVALSTAIKKGSNVFIAPNATVIGKTTLGDNVTVMFGAVIRADGDTITIGSRSNVQDNAVIHVDPGCPVSIGHDCIIGHLAIVHGATLGNHVLLGMNATVLNNAKIGDWCIIGANTLVPEGMEIPEGSLVVGTPARILRQLTDEQKEKVRLNAEAYVQLGEAYLEALG